MENTTTYTAFAGERRIAAGELKPVLLKVKRRLDEGEDDPVLIFDDRTGGQVDFDFRGAPQEVLDRLATHPLFAPKAETAGAAKAGPGRPRLGVVSREVSLLPRHWDWLEKQPQGISAAVRRLVEEAAKREPSRERGRLARDAAGKFMWAMAGNLPNFEEAARALYALDLERLDRQTRAWPKDIRAHLRKQMQEAVALTTGEGAGAKDGPGVSEAAAGRRSPPKSS